MIGWLEQYDPGLLEHAIFLVLRERTPRSLLDELRHQYSCRPIRELERLRRVVASEQHYLDSTHPPTGKRVRMLEAWGADSPRVHLSPQQSERIDRELAHAAKARVENQLLREARDAELHGAARHSLPSGSGK